MPGPGLRCADWPVFTLSYLDSTTYRADAQAGNDELCWSKSPTWLCRGAIITTYRQCAHALKSPDSTPIVGINLLRVAFATTTWSASQDN